MPLLTVSSFTSTKFSFEFLYSFGPTHARKIETEVIFAAFNKSGGGVLGEGQAPPSHQLGAAV